MKKKSSKVPPKHENDLMSEASNSSLFEENSSRNSLERFLSQDSNSFETNPFHASPTKRVRTTEKANFEKQRDQDLPKVHIDTGSIPNRAIEALEQFKWSVRSRKDFVSPFGESKVTVPKLRNTELTQIITQQSTKETDRKTKKRKDLLEPPEILSQSARSSDREDNKEGLISPSKDSEKDFEFNEIEYRIPEWAVKENARDAKGNKFGDSNYDPNTLKIPRGGLDSFTPLMKQYWEIKSQHFSEILLFKVGDFYRVCYDDAVICHKELNLNWLGNKMIVGVHEKNFEKNIQRLVDLGYRVCVAEQTETQKEKNKRVKTQKESGERVIKRQISQVMSKGTFIDYNNPNYEPRYLLSLRIRRNEVALVLLEIGYSVITMGYFNDDEHFLTLKTLLSQVKPTEVVYEKTSIDPSLIQYFKNSLNAPILSPISNPKLWNTIYVHEELEKYYGEQNEWPETLKKILQMEASKRDLVLMSFASMIAYLHQTLTVDQVLQTARYEDYDPLVLRNSRMILDAQSLQHLEILEVPYSCRNPFEGSLLSYVHNTVTKYGKRLLKRWICAPLIDVEAIDERLDAIEELQEKYEIRDRLRDDLKRLPDFERLCGKIYSLSIKKPDNLILFEDVSINRLKEFKNIIESFQKARDLIADIQDLEWNSNLLKRLLTLHDHKAVLNNQSSDMPDILSLLEELSSFIVWEGTNRDVPVPKQGVDKEYDKVRNEIEAIGRELNHHLEEVKAKFGGNNEICYTHIKQRYEIEIPAVLVIGSKRPADFEISSKRKGYERFITKRVTELVPKLEEAEEKLQGLLKLFVCFVFRYFYTYNKAWDRFINGLAQIDCLCSLSVTSFLTDEQMCRPKVHPFGDRVFFEARSLSHPCISSIKQDFIPNDILLGDTGRDHNNIILITGPNMGGKSTVLRQTCLAAILAQIGCYVPAEYCELSAVDRIFTRIGASDRLVEGKSTFSIEMEETLNVLKAGTKDSLVIMDELGRGTTTFDGLAIAYAVLKHFSDKLKCRTLFATHYHALLDYFREDPHIAFYYMAYHVDDKYERIKFLYRLTKGECSKSFGLNIAKVAGLPPGVVQRGKEKAEEFEREFHLKESIRIKKNFTNIINLFSERKEEGNGNAEELLSALSKNI